MKLENNKKYYMWTSLRMSLWFIILILFNAHFSLADPIGEKKQDVSEKKPPEYVQLKLDGECCEKEREFIWNYFDLSTVEKSMKGAGMLPGIEVLIGMYDLNEDGLNDILVMERSSYHCSGGPAGCSFQIFMQQKKGKYIQTDDNWVVPWNISVSENITKGMHDLIFQGQWGAGSVVQWNGKNYQHQKQER